MAHDDPNEEHRQDPESEDAGLSEEILAELRAAESGDSDSPLLDNARVSEDYATELDALLEEEGMEKPVVPAPRDVQANPIANALQDIVSLLEQDDAPPAPVAAPTTPVEAPPPATSARDLLEELVASLRDAVSGADKPPAPAPETEAPDSDVPSAAPPIQEADRGRISANDMAPDTEKPPLPANATDDTVEPFLQETTSGESPGQGFAPDVAVRGEDSIEEDSITEVEAESQETDSAEDLEEELPEQPTPDEAGIEVEATSQVAEPAEDSKEDLPEQGEIESDNVEGDINPQETDSAEDSEEELPEQPAPEEAGVEIEAESPEADPADGSEEDLPDRGRIESENVEGAAESQEPVANEAAEPAPAEQMPVEAEAAEEATAPQERDTGKNSEREPPAQSAPGENQVFESSEQIADDAGDTLPDSDDHTANPDDEEGVNDLLTPESMADYEELASLAGKYEDHAGADEEDTEMLEEPVQAGGIRVDLSAFDLDTDEGLADAIVHVVEQAEASGATAEEDIAPPSHTAPIGSPPPLPDDKGFTQQELDRFLAIQRGDPPPAEVEPDTGAVPASPTVEAPAERLSGQDEIDALLAAAIPEAAELREEFTADAVDSTVDQDAIDALLKNEPVADSEVPAEEEASLSQDDLDALMAQMGGGGQDAPEEDAAATPPENAEEEASLSQDDLDALMAQMGGGGQDAPEEDAAATPPENAEEEASLSQDDLDALMAQMDGGNQDAPEEDAAATPPENAEEEASLSQDDLDALMAQIGGDTAEPEDKPEETAEANTDLSQDDLDGLLAQMGGDAAQPAQEKAESETEAGSDLSQDDLDALLANLGGEVDSLDAAPPASVPATEEPAKEVNHEDGEHPKGNLADQPTPLDTSDRTPPPAPEDAPAQEKSEPRTAEEQRDDDEDALVEDDLEALIAAVDRDTAETSDEDPLGGGEEVDQNMVDALLEEITASPGFESGREGETLAGGEMDDPIVGSPSTAEKPSAPTGSQTEETEGPVNQDLIDALLASAAGEEAPQPKQSGSVSQENLAAAATAPKKDPGLLSQDDLDAILRDAKENDQARQRAKEKRLEEATTAPHAQADPESPSEPRSQGKRFRRKRASHVPGPLRRFIQSQAPRIAASLIMGAMATLGTFTALYRSQEQTPPLALLEAAASAPTLESAMRRAKDLMGAGEYAQAAESLVEPMAEARQSAAGLPMPILADAGFLYAEARYRALPVDPGLQASESVINLIDKAVEGSATHPRAPYALHWKGQLLEKQEMLSAAAAAYDRVIDNYGDAPNRDEVLLDAARLALARKKPESALMYARQIMQHDPTSPKGMEAELLIADAYALSGMLDEARSIYVEMAEDVANTAEGSQAFQRLGEIALARGRYSEAADLFEQRLETATTTTGNDRTYYKLAQAYRQMDRLEDARNALNDLINFFPESDITPMAYVELAQTMEGLGEQQESLRLAQQAVSRYPENPTVLRNAGDMLGRAGQAGRAADMLVAADAAGAGDPSVLLRAGGYYVDAAMPIQALKTYESIAQTYPRAPQAIRGGVEAANVLYDLGQATEAVERLENIAETSTGSPHRLPALTSLARIYSDLGLDERLAQVAQQIAAASSEPAVLAQAAQSLIEAGAVEEGMRMAERVDPARLSAHDAYELTQAQGKALLRYAPRRALDKLEEAYSTYPEARTLDGDRVLFDTYLALDQRAAARRMITEIAAYAQASPVDAPKLIDAAVSWGDHLARIGDHREAINAYAMVIESAERAGELDPVTAQKVEWARYQQANALLEGFRFSESLALLDEIAASNAPWAQEASLKAEFARAEQRLRGGPETPQESR